MRVIVSPTTGLDHIDLDVCKARGVDVLSLRGETEFLQNVHATAEHTIALMLALIRNIPSAHYYTTRYEDWDRDRFIGHELHGKRLGIIGYGRIGKQVQKMALGFDMRTHVSDPESGYKLEWVLGHSDIVTAHVPLLPTTIGMFGQEQFEAMPKGSYFINTSRGAIVDEGALYGALMDKHLAGAALDVLSFEPDVVDKALLNYARNHDNLIITPHIGGNTVESREQVEAFMEEKLQAWGAEHGVLFAV